MQDVTDAFLESLATDHAVVTEMTHLNPLSGVTSDVLFTDGQVQGDATAFVRRTLTFTAPNLESLFQTLSVPGGEITVRTGIKYGSTTELVPAGVYRVDLASINYSTTGAALSLTCPDRSVVVQRARMGPDRSSVASNMVWQEIQRLVEGSFTSVYQPFPGWSQLDTTATTKVGPQIYDAGNRDAVIAQFCTDNSLDFGFDADGKAVLRPIPTAPIGTWTTAFGPGGVMVDATRSRSLADTRNVIVLTTTATDIQMPAVEVANVNDPTTDPLSSLGPLGRQVEDYQGNFRTTAQATAAGVTRLALKCAVQQQLTVEAMTNAALDFWDQITAQMLTTDLGTKPSESRIVQAFMLPLTTSAQQQITARQTVAA